MPTAELFEEDISHDFVEGLPPSREIPVVLVVKGRLLKYSHFILLSHPYTTKAVAKAFQVNVRKLHAMGRP